MKRRITIIISIIFLVFIIDKLNYLLRPTNHDESIQAIQTFHEMPDNSFEVIAHGSSHIWKTLNPLLLYDKYGIGSYNYGDNGEPLNSTLLFLEESLLTQKPKIVIIETYLVHKVLENENVNGEIYYTKAIKNFKGKKDYLKQVFGNDIERYISYYLPIYTFHDNWTNINEQSFKERNHKKMFRNNFGYYYLDKVVPIKLGKYVKEKQLKLNDSSITVLDKIMKLSKEYNFKVIFITVPFNEHIIYRYSDAMEEYALKNDADYINFFKLVDEIGLDETKDFADKGHTNINGANKISDYLGKYIKDNYELTDFREIKNNLWEQQLKGV